MRAGFVQFSRFAGRRAGLAHPQHMSMPIPENLPHDIRPQRLPLSDLMRLAKRVVYFPYDYQSTSGRHYKGDVRAALGHGLAVELEREQQERQHNQELAALRAEIAALSILVDGKQELTPRVGDEGASHETTGSRVTDIAGTALNGGVLDEAENDHVTLPDEGATR
jgi:hypothetical protein